MTQVGKNLLPLATHSFVFESWFELEWREVNKNFELKWKKKLVVAFSKDALYLTVIDIDRRILSIEKYTVVTGWSNTEKCSQWTVFRQSLDN